MSSISTDPQKLGRIAGWLFVITFLTSIPALLLYGPVLNHDSYILGAGSDSQLSLGAFLRSSWWSPTSAPRSHCSRF